ncbi:DUF6221 family protein [Streptomyces sp. NPDC056672]|uniref:DUF6221 family protein n=1 Tax=Streptomyces sp. NPDC056672 TaxID=3345906 RepID=UPI0036B03D13
MDRSRAHGRLLPRRTLRFHPTIALHVALHDPARVLREVEAKRRLLSRHVLSPATGDLASPYADHPDYPRRP